MPGSSGSVVGRRSALKSCGKVIESEGIESSPDESVDDWIWSGPLRTVRH